MLLPADELEIEARHADHMADMARYWMLRAQEAERMCAILIASAGGEIVVKRGALCSTGELVVERWDEVRDMSTHFRTRPTPSQKDRDP